MAQRVLTCPNCGAPIEVPMDYFGMNIACPSCGVQVNRRSGQLATSGAAAPPPPQQGPMQYPQYGPPPQWAGTAQATKRTSPLMRVIVVLGCAGALFLILALAAIPLITSKLSADGNWHKHSNALGGFEVEFPSTPKTSSKNVETGLGQRVFHTVSVHTGGVYFEAGWTDLGPGAPYQYTFNYTEAVQGFAKDKKGTVQSQQAHKVGQYTGSKAVIKGPGSAISTIVLVRRGNRVHTVLVENHAPRHQAVVDRFIGTFKLVPLPGEDFDE